MAWGRTVSHAGCRNQPTAARAGGLLGRGAATRTMQTPQHNKEQAMSLSLILLIVLILILIGALPTWGHSRSWGYGPSGGIGLVVLILVVLLLMGRI